MVSIFQFFLLNLMLAAESMAASALHLQAPLCVVVPWMVPLLPSANLCSTVGARVPVYLSVYVCVRALILALQL